MKSSFEVELWRPTPPARSRTPRRFQSNFQKASNCVRPGAFKKHSIDLDTLSSPAHIEELSLALLKVFGFVRSYRWHSHTHILYVIDGLKKAFNKTLCNIWNRLSRVSPSQCSWCSTVFSNSLSLYFSGKLVEFTVDRRLVVDSNLNAGSGWQQFVVAHVISAPSANRSSLPDALHLFSFSLVCFFGENGEPATPLNSACCIKV